MLKVGDIVVIKSEKEIRKEEENGPYINRYMIELCDKETTVTKIESEGIIRLKIDDGEWVRSMNYVIGTNFRKKYNKLKEMKANGKEK